MSNESPFGNGVHQSMFGVSSIVYSSTVRSTPGEAPYSVLSLVITLDNGELNHLDFYSCGADPLVMTEKLAWAVPI